MVSREWCGVKSDYEMTTLMLIHGGSVLLMHAGSMRRPQHSEAAFERVVYNSLILHQGAL